MADDKTKKSNPDRERVNLDEPYEVEYWTKKWGVSKEELHNAVGAVGVMVNKIEVWLRNNGRIK